MQSSFTQKSPGAIKENALPGQEYNGEKSLAGLNQNASTRLGFLEQTTQTIKSRRQKFANNPGLRNRIITHITMLIVAFMAIGLSRLDLSWGTISAIRPLKYETQKPETSGAETGNPLTLPGELRNIQDDVLVRSAVPHTIIPDRTTQSAQLPAQSETGLLTYAVQGGDNISSIAAKFGLEAETIIWANPDLEYNPDLLSVGQELTILPVDGVYHQIGSGDTIAGIAATFQTDSQLIINHPANNLDPDNLVIRAGEWLVVPGGRKPFKPRAVTAYSGPAPADATLGTGIFGWPASGTITQGYYGYHPGIDVAGWLGAPILAADSGYVIAAGWDNTGYGINVVIDHGNGFQTLYAHLQAYNVEPGTNVSKGQQIGEMGSTGNSTGPHLHFEIRHGTVQRNPYGFLP